MSTYTPKNILVTGGAGFMYAHKPNITLTIFRSGSHVVIHLVRNYPQYNVVNFDKLDYCSSIKNLACIEEASNYKFIQVCSNGKLCN
jgi:dTDP-D-glucose 4,6-dehydratase